MRQFVISILASLLLSGASPTLAEEDATTVFRVSGMTCGMCVKAIEKSLRSVSGVRSVSIDRESRRVEVVADSAVDVLAIEAAIEGAGSYEAKLDPGLR